MTSIIINNMKALKHVKCWVTFAAFLPILPVCIFFFLIPVFIQWIRKQRRCIPETYRSNIFHPERLAFQMKHIQRIEHAKKFLSDENV